MKKSNIPNSLLKYERRKVMNTRDKHVMDILHSLYKFEFDSLLCSQSWLNYFFQFFIRSHFENDVITLFLITYTCLSLVERWWKLRANFQRRWYCSAKVNHVVKHRLSLTEKRMYAHSKRIMKTSVKGIYSRKIRLENLIVIESTQ